MKKFLAICLYAEVHIHTSKESAYSQVNLLFNYFQSEKDANVYAGIASINWTDYSKI